MSRSSPRRGLAFLLVAAASAAAAAWQVPPLRGPIVDDAGLLAATTAQQLDAALRRLWEGGGSQLAVLTVPELDGLPIEQASIQITDAWKLGTAGKDNGVLLMVAKAERAVRIEVGQGHEGDLTDAYSRRIIDDVIVPRFKTGDFDAGIALGVRAILSYTDPTFDLGLAVEARAYGGHAGDFTLGQVVFFVILLLVIAFVSRFHTAYGRHWNRSSGWSGGGMLRGGGFGGGGGFRGGGGGFSGGGASGRW